jgi:putative glutamine amidotransferase
VQLKDKLHPFSFSFTISSIYQMRSVSSHLAPLIGLSGNFQYGWQAKLFSFSEAPYLRAVRAAGGFSSFLTLDLKGNRLEAALCALAGFILLGGDDVDPRLYGERKCRATKGIKARRDALEMAMTQHAIRYGKPLLAICRGIQLVNVALGGTLHQHIVSDLPGAFQHDQHKDENRRTRRRDHPAHEVIVTPGTLLARILKTRSIVTNSLHHQGLNTIANGLFVSGRCRLDGLVEAVELRGHPFFLGVQWHPEEMTASAEMRSIFRAFVAACRQGVSRA